jgi:RNA-directed DNA polymerase
MPCILMATWFSAEAGRLSEGASSRERLYNWAWHEKNVNRLQSRTVKAVKAGKWNKAKALQRLLTRSFGAKVLAVKRVTTNKGKNTPGVDKQLWRDKHSKEEAIAGLTQRGYTPQPLRRVLIPKSNGKMRPLG